MIKDILLLINKHNPLAFYTIESIKFVNKSVFHKSVPDKKRHRILPGK